MARYIRFIVHQRIKGAPRRSGLFAAAYSLVRQEELLPHDRERIEQLLKWFVAELAVPPQGSIPDDAIFWYIDIGPFTERMWELVHLLNEYSVSSELITASFVGKVVYRDEHQVAAIPRRRDRWFKGT